MDDWLAPAPEPHEIAAPAQRDRRPRGATPTRSTRSPTCSAGPARPRWSSAPAPTTPDGWAGLTQLAERLDSPVFQEAFGARAGFPQDHPLFAGHLSPAAARARDARGLRRRSSSSARPSCASTPTSPARWSPRARASRSSPTTRRRRTARSPSWPSWRRRAPSARRWPSASPAARTTAARRARRARRREPPGPGEPLRAGHLLAALAERLPRDAVLIEEAPSARPELHARVPAREPLGFLSAAMGGLGFALPAAIGLRMGRPDRPVVAVVGDGASLYQIQALWSAAHYGAGALFIVLANGRYAIMDRLAEATGKAGPWPAFDAVDVAAVARGFGCPAATIEDHDDAAAHARRGASEPRRALRAAAARGRRRTRHDVRALTPPPEAGRLDAMAMAAGPEVERAEELAALHRVALLVARGRAAGDRLPRRRRAERRAARRRGRRGAALPRRGARRRAELVARARDARAAGQRRGRLRGPAERARQGARHAPAGAPGQLRGGRGGAAAATCARPACGASLAAPVLVDGEVWGALAVSTIREDRRSRPAPRSGSRRSPSSSRRRSPTPRRGGGSSQAADESRQRLERELHEGAQQHLLALTLKLRLAHERAEEGSLFAKLLAEALADANEATAALDDLGRSLHPAVLGERGLAPALQALAARAPCRSTCGRCRRGASTPRPRRRSTASSPTACARPTARSRSAWPTAATGCTSSCAAAPGTGLEDAADRVAALGGHLEIEAGGRGRARSCAGRCPWSAKWSPP